MATKPDHDTMSAMPASSIDATHKDGAQRGAEPPRPMMNREEFSEEVRQHHRQLVSYAVALTGSDPHRARDLVQDALITAYRKLDKFDTSRDFSTWVRGIIRNHWRDELRKKRPIPIEDSALQALEEQHRQWDGLYTPESDVFDALSECLTRLPEDFRSAVERFYYQGDTGDEAANFLKTSPASLRKRLQRARTQLRDCLELKTESATGATA